MSSTTKTPQIWFRLSMLLLGILILGWLPMEDVDLRAAFLFAGTLCGIIAANFLLQIPDYPAKSIRIPLTGAVAGLTVCPIVILIMTFKSGLHGHGSPDITFSDILSILKLTPLWGCSGLIIGTGVRLWKLSKAIP